MQARPGVCGPVRGGPLHHSESDPREADRGGEAEDERGGAVGAGEEDLPLRRPREPRRVQHLPPCVCVRVSA
jgi:hypothetical protein